MTVLFILFVIFLAIVSVIVTAVFYLLSRQKELPPTDSQETFESLPPYRSLFDPDEEELTISQREQDEQANKR